MNTNQPYHTHTNDPEKVWIWYEGDLLHGPMTIEDLHKEALKGKIDDDTQIFSNEEPSAVYQYRVFRKFSIQFSPSLDQLIEARRTHPTTVFSGPNNSGKSLLLKNLRTELTENTFFIACGRIHSIQYLPNSSNQNISELHRQAMQQLQTDSQNLENNFLSLDRIIADLMDKKRNQLFSLSQRMLDNTFKIKRKIKGNALSQYYVDMDGENLGYSSTGTRILMTLLGILLDERFNIILIDEPELGLNPKIQSTLAHHLLNEQKRKETFPHITQVYIATHSHIFLDQTLENNFIVEKKGKNVIVTKIKTVNEFNRLQFDMLGNRLESLHLPSAIVLVEGPSDYPFISKLVDIFIPSKKITAVNCGGAGDAQNKLQTLKEAFGDLDKSPYNNKIHVVLDSTHPAKISTIKKFGIPDDNITQWKNNGIEYYYPKSIVAAIFRSDPANPLKDATIDDNSVSVNGITKTKRELGNLVTAKLTQSTKLDPELENFLNKLK